MKKIFTALLAIFVTVTAFGQVENANRLILHSKSGETVVYNLEEMDYMDFDVVGEVGVTLALSEGSVTDAGFTVSAVPTAGCQSYTVTLEKGGEVVSDASSYSAAAEIPFEGLEAGTTYTVTAVPFDLYGLAGAAASIQVTTASKTVDPKVGDYYYSDGTWSDGGLISIDANGMNAVWAEEKPAPIEGKTVIGIVFNVDPDRIAQADKDAGFTHGYVIGCKNVTDPNKSNYEQWPETVWYSSEPELTTISVTKVSKTWYSNLSGREETQKMLAAFPDDAATAIPLFYYSTTGYPVAAPEGTSGWFVPSTGQMWTCIANFCSGAVAEFLDEYSTDRYDMTYNSENTTEAVFENFMRVFSLVPAADKDEITHSDNTNPASVALVTSSRYDTESSCHFNLGIDDKGVIEGMTGWFNEDRHARPILAF